MKRHDDKHPDSELHFYQLISHTPPEGMLLNPKRAKTRERLTGIGSLLPMAWAFGLPLFALGFMFGAVESKDPLEGLTWATIFAGPAVLFFIWASIRSPLGSFGHGPRFIPDPDYNPETRRIEKPRPVETPKPAALPAPEPRPAPPFGTRSIEELQRTTARHDLRLALGRLMDGVPAWIERQGDLPMTVDRQRGNHLVRMLEERCREMMYSQSISKSDSAQAKLAESANEAANFVHGTLAKLDRMEVDQFELKLRLQDRQATFQC